MRPRSASRFMSAATSSRATPSARFAYTQSGLLTRKMTISRKWIRPKTRPTRPSAARSEDVIAVPLAPPHRLDRGLRQHEEARDHHGEVGEVLRVDEPLQQILEVGLDREPAQEAGDRRGARGVELGKRWRQR